MFDRVLYVDEEIALELSWFGLGRLVAKHRLGGKRVAHPLQKRAFLIACEAFERAGQPVNPSNPKFSCMAKDVAHMLMYQAPSGLSWGAFFNDPEEFGRSAAK